MKILKNILLLFCIILGLNAKAQTVDYTYKALAAEGCNMKYSVAKQDTIYSIIATVRSDRMNFLTEPTMKIRTFTGKYLELRGTVIENGSQSAGVISGNIVIPVTEISSTAQFRITPQQFEILNEGVDIVEVNQVIMLRPTQSPIVFIQQLGRGLRKAEGKEYVVILDFIGNYNNNFMIPIALSGDRTYNPDNIRRYVISGNTTIPGASSIHFDEIAKEKIFTSIDKIKGMPTIIRESYLTLKNRLGRVPYLLDFYENGEIDPLVIIREYKTYQKFLELVEKDSYVGRISEQDLITLEYLSKTILSGTRPYELEMLRKILQQPSIKIDEFATEIQKKYGHEIDYISLASAVDVLQGKFVSKAEEYEKYCHIDT